MNCCRILKNPGLLLLFIFFIQCTEEKQPSIVSAFLATETNPSVIRFYNEKEVNNNGGHLQGVQPFENESGKYFFLTGSSDTCSYYAVAKLNSRNEVLFVHPLMGIPFKHAGGFQIFEHYLAVGIEDNSAKNRSKVFIFDISEPEKPVTIPVAVIERTGEPLRTTAGCVGITKHKNKALIAVGDWDTKHIDFYSCPFEQMGKQEFKKNTTIDLETISREKWIDNEWHPYQNINLFSMKNELYLIGLGQNQHSENIADLFQVTENGREDFHIKKLASKTFHCSNGVSFRAGAGASFTNTMKINVVACGNHLGDDFYLNLY